MGVPKPIYCVSCHGLRMTQEFPRYRRLKGVFICERCEPPARGRRTDRHYDAQGMYKCRSCSRELGPDWYDIRSARGRRYVEAECRRCKRDAAFMTKHGVDEQEAQLISDVLYDFDLARTMFGMSYREAVAWILRGYGYWGVTEAKLHNWGATENRREVWLPDE